MKKYKLNIKEKKFLYYALIAAFFLLSLVISFTLISNQNSIEAQSSQEECDNLYPPAGLTRFAEGECQPTSIQACTALYGSGNISYQSIPGENYGICVPEDLAACVTVYGGVQTDYNFTNGQCVPLNAAACANINGGLATDYSFTDATCFAANQNACNELFGTGNSIFDSNLQKAQKCVAINQTGCDNVYGTTSLTYSFQSGEHFCLASNQVGCDALFDSGNTVYNSTLQSCTPINQTGCDNIYGATTTTYRLEGSQNICYPNNQSGCDALYTDGATTFSAGATVEANQCIPANQTGCDVFFGTGTTVYSLTEICLAINQSGCDVLFPNEGRIYFAQGTTNLTKCIFSSTSSIPNTGLVDDLFGRYIYATAGVVFILISLHIVVFIIPKRRRDGESEDAFLY